MAKRTRGNRRGKRASGEKPELDRPKRSFVFYSTEREAEDAQCYKDLRGLEHENEWEIFNAIMSLKDRWVSFDPTLTEENVKNLGGGLWEFRIEAGRRRQVRLYFMIDNGVAIGLTAFDKPNSTKAEAKAKAKAATRWGYYKQSKRRRDRSRR